MPFCLLAVGHRNTKRAGTIEVPTHKKPKKSHKEKRVPLSHFSQVALCLVLIFVSNALIANQALYYLIFDFSSHRVVNRLIIQSISVHQVCQFYLRLSILVCAKALPATDFDVLL